MAPISTHDLILDQAMQLFLDNGVSATSVDVICSKAGVTKGAFFHHFATKEAMVLAVLERWNALGQGFYAGAPFLSMEDPLERVLGYIDHTRLLSTRRSAPLGCLIGLCATEMGESTPAVRASCSRSLAGWAAGLEALLVAAVARHPPRIGFSPRALALHFVVVFEGAQVLARATGKKRVVADQLDHFRTFLLSRFREAQ